jgi:hypothetical protein
MPVIFAGASATSPFGDRGDVGGFVFARPTPFGLHSRGLDILKSLSPCPR